MKKLFSRLALFTSAIAISSIFASSVYATDSLATAGNQSFLTNDVATAANQLTIINVDTDMTAANDVRVRIPSGVNMTWDSTDTSITCNNVSGTPCSNISTTVSYESSDKIVIIDVTSNLAGSDQFQISGLAYTNFTAGSGVDGLDLCVDGSCTAVETSSSQLVHIFEPTVSSSDARTFFTGQSTQAMDWTLTITESPHTYTSDGATAINATEDLLIKIPSTLNMAWDPSDTAISVSGTDYAKVEQTEGGSACAADPCTVTVTYAQTDGSTACTGSDCKVLRIPIDTTWSAGDDITVTGATVFEFGDNMDSAVGLGIETNGTSATKTATATHTVAPIIVQAVDNNSSGSGSDSGPGAPTGLTATQTADGVVLAWTDPSSSDLANVQVLRGVGNFPVSGDAYASVTPGTQTYTDTSVEVGETYKYVIRGVNTNGTQGATSSQVSIVIAEEVPEESSSDETTQEVTLEAQNDSGQSGTVTLVEKPTETSSLSPIFAGPILAAEESGTDLEVTIALTGTPENLAGVEQPAYIYSGTCDELDEVAYTLTPVVDGSSVTTLPDLSLADLAANGPYAINIHESDDNIASHVACGNIASAQEDVTAEEDETTTSESNETTTEPPNNNTPTPVVEFRDVENHWAEEQITDLAEDDIVKGNPDGDIAPDNNINRAEAAALAARIVSRVTNTSEPGAPSSKPFNDVEVNAWYAGYIAFLLENSLVASKANFDVGSPMNRAEYLQLMVNVFNFVAEDLGRTPLDTDQEYAGGKYGDLNSGAWYFNTVMAADQAGFVNGSDCASGKCFNGDADITRAEAFTMIHNMWYIGDGQGF